MIGLLIVAFATTAFARDVSTFVVGGQDAAQGQWPWQLGLYRNNSYSCGASLISASTAVCAAQCVNGQTAADLSVKAGSIDRTCTTECDTSSLSSYLIHPDYTSIALTGYRNDVALLYLETPMMEDPGRIGYVPLAATGTHEGETCFITGWGLTSGGGSLATTLQEAQIDVLTTLDCENYWPAVQITDNHVCAFDSSNQTIAACNGDAGGPLACLVGGVWELAGVTSWGDDTCSTAFPSVFTRITAYRDWIITNMQ